MHIILNNFFNLHISQNMFFFLICLFYLQFQLFICCCVKFVLFYWCFCCCLLYFCYLKLGVCFSICFILNT